MRTNAALAPRYHEIYGIYVIGLFCAESGWASPTRDIAEPIAGGANDYFDPGSCNTWERGGREEEEERHRDGTIKITKCKMLIGAEIEKKSHT